MNTRFFSYVAHVAILVVALQLQMIDFGWVAGWGLRGLKTQNFKWGTPWGPSSSNQEEVVSNCAYCFCKKSSTRLGKLVCATNLITIFGNWRSFHVFETT